MAIAQQITEIFSNSLNLGLLGLGIALAGSFYEMEGKAGILMGIFILLTGPGLIIAALYYFEIDIIGPIITLPYISLILDILVGYTILKTCIGVDQYVGRILVGKPPNKQ